MRSQEKKKKEKKTFDQIEIFTIVIRLNNQRLQ